MANPKQSVLRTVLPDEHFIVELRGRVGPSEWWRLLLPVLELGVSEIDVGLNKDELVLADPPTIHEPAKVRRFPLNRVRLLSHTEGLMDDQILLELGEAKPLQIRFEPVHREQTRQFKSLLSGEMGAVRAPEDGPNQ